MRAHGKAPHNRITNKLPATGRELVCYAGTHDKISRFMYSHALRDVAEGGGIMESYGVLFSSRTGNTRALQEAVLR